jgi:tellurite resistance protein TerC
MAILGLRALFFLLAAIMDNLYYLRHGLAAALGFIGIKLLLPLGEDIPKFIEWLASLVGAEVRIPHLQLDVPVMWSLIVVLGCVTIAVLASLVRSRYMPQEDSEEKETETPGVK